jgi:hypothetical protein
MGAIGEDGTERVFFLESDHLIGRSDLCSSKLSEPSVSAQHLSIRWTGQGWVMKDLGSRYGTFVDGQPLQPGVLVEIHKGTRFVMGREKHAWTVLHDEAPEAMVVPADGGQALFVRDGMIAVPSVEQPLALVFQGDDNRWYLDQNGQNEVLQERQQFTVAGVAWKLCNTRSPQYTSIPDEPPLSMALREARAHFEVSRNEEHVHLVLWWRDRSFDFSARAFHYVLLTLARLRLRDRDLPEASAGWVDQDELLRLLQFGPERLNLDIFRARRQFGAAGFIPATGIVERRPASRELRLGISNIVIDVV